VKRLRRHFFTTCAAISLLACIAVGVLCRNRGYSLLQGRYNRSPEPDALYAYYVGFESFAGTLTFHFSHRHFAPLYLQTLDAEQMRAFRIEYPTGWRWYAAGPQSTSFRSTPTPGFRARHYVDTRWVGYRSDDWTLAVPHWVVMALLLVMPVVVGSSRFLAARRARQTGRCAVCGYDLRATPQRCPECGTIAASEVAA
jgi:hypothetical protein